jgi:hypothetical protein
MNVNGKIEARGRNGWFSLKEVEVYPGGSGEMWVVFYSMRVGTNPPIVLSGNPKHLAALVRGLADKVEKQAKQ